MLDGNTMFSLCKETRALDRVGAPAIVTNLSRADECLQQFDHGRHFLNRIVPNVQLIKINHIRIQAAQTGFALGADMQKVIILPKCYAFFDLIYVEAKFCRDHGLIAFPSQGASQNPFTVTCAVVCSRIEEGNAVIEGTMDGTDRFFVINIAPAARSVEPVPGPTDRPTTQSHRTDLKVRSSHRSLEYFCSHLFFLSGFFPFSFCNDLLIDFNLVADQLQMFIQLVYTCLHVAPQ